MDIFERFHQKFGRWYERLFGDDGSQALRPKDVLRRILDAMEENRSEGFDGKIYVPNKYVLELGVSDPDEREYLLSFLDEEELTGVLQRYMAQNGYSARGPLDFTIVDTDPEESDEKLRVKARFGKAPATEPTPAPQPVQPAEEDDLLTVAAVRPIQDDDGAEDLTIAGDQVSWAALVIAHSDGRRSLTTISTPEFHIGRSKQAGNHLILSGDGQVSKKHARIERESDGKATIYDLGSTNGVIVNGRLIDGNVTLNDGDEIVIGGTTMVFQQELVAAPQASSVIPSAIPAAVSRAKLAPAVGAPATTMGSETLIGRGVTCDVVLDDDLSSIRQATIVSPDGVNYYIQDVSGKQTTKVNGRPVIGDERIRLQDGDSIELGASLFTFVAPDGTKQ